MDRTIHDQTILADATDWRSRDLEVLWHPCTQMREHHGAGADALPLLPVASGSGVWLTSPDGRRTLDAVSSWWVNLFGHAEPRIAAAIGRQAQTLEHVILAGCSHQPAVELAERLLAIAPRQPGRDPLTKVFYADNGSAGVEVALKMAFQWFRNRGDEPRRTKFVALENGYHGETIGALSVGDIPLYRRVYAPLLMEAMFAPSPDAYLAAAGRDAEAQAEEAADALARLFDEHPGEICALVLEPLVQCAGGMRMYHPIYLKRARELCDVHGAFLIADEIAVGFGRTGTMFAFEQAGVMPDLMCLSKGLTGGFLPLAAVLATQAIYDGFLDESRERAFLHSHSYTGNPLACAAALATLDIFASDDVLARNRVTAGKMATLAAPLAQLPHVADVRQTGMILAIELTRDGRRDTPFDPGQRIGLHAYNAALERGVLLRPLGDILYWMPPYCIQDDELQLLADVTRTVIEEVTP